ncbi:MAG: hypothetical protein IJ916_11920 [Paludibacteraceae bacterium]|nr:hypothetical protein [Paludibacteraceae bacterium]
MKKIAWFPFLFCSSVLLSCCQPKAEQQPETPQNVTPLCNQAPIQEDSARYDVISFIRKGGGNMAFLLQAKKDSLSFFLYQMNFQDTSLVFSFEKQHFDSTDVALLDSLLNGTIDLKEPISEQPQRPMMTGTWVYTYAIKPSGETDTITLKRAEEVLIHIEDSIRNMLSN